MEGMEPDGSSSEMRSTRGMGKKMVGKPMRPASNWLIWLTKWSKEFKSTPRKVTPLGLISSRMPQIFSRGECRLTMTIELGSMNVSCIPSRLPQANQNLAKRCEGSFRRVKRVLRATNFLYRHDCGPVRGKLELRLGKRLHLFERCVGCQFAKHKALRRNVDE